MESRNEWSYCFSSSSEHVASSFERVFLWLDPRQLWKGFQEIVNMLCDCFFGSTKGVLTVWHSYCCRFLCCQFPSEEFFIAPQSVPQTVESVTPRFSNKGFGSNIQHWGIQLLSIVGIVCNEISQLLSHFDFIVKVRRLIQVVSQHLAVFFSSTIVDRDCFRLKREGI